MRRILIAAAYLLILATSVAQAAPEFTGGMWVGDINGLANPGGWYMTEERFDWMMRQPELEYMFCQWTIADVFPPSETTINARNRIRAMAAAGKKVILQLWANMDTGPTNWSYYSIPHTTLDPFVRMRWYATLGEGIRFFGPENLYAVHLWEELAGVNVGWSIPGTAENWRENAFEVRSGSVAAAGGPYSPAGWPIGRDKAKGDGPWLPDMQEYRDVILDKVGVDTHKADDWTEADYRQFRLFVSRYCLAEMNIKFAAFVHKQFPGVKVFTWCYPAMAGDKWTDIGWEATHGIDGWIGDPYYQDHGMCYSWIRAARTLFPPGKEVHAVFHNDRPQAFLNRQVQVAYAGGANSVCFFSGDNNRRNDAGLTEADIAIRKFVDRPLARPVLEAPYDTLVVADDYYNAVSKLYKVLGGRFDVVSSVDRYAVDETKYRRVLDTTNGQQALWQKGVN